MKEFKIKVEDFIYKYITKWYVKLTNKRNYNLDVMKPNYTYSVNENFKGCTYGVYQPIECVYFALLKVYGHIRYLNIQGITMDYSNKNTIQVKIMTARPGLIIGKGGKDIEQLTFYLNRYFGKLVEVNLVEVKTNFIYTNY